MDASRLSNDFSEPPPNVRIHPKDWLATSLEVRREFWLLWINFRTASDGTFSTQLRLMLDRRELNQKNFAELIHQSAPVVSRWLKGRKVKIEEERNHIPDEFSTVSYIVQKLNADELEKYLLVRAYALEVLWVKGFWDE